MHQRIITLIFLSLAAGRSRCDTQLSQHDDGQLSFSLVRRCQRSQLTVVEVENTQTLQQCFALARSVRGLALNYAPPQRRRQGNLFDDMDVRSRVARFNASRTLNRQPFWQQPQEFFNCHVLQCPENATLRSLVNDSRFDYFSLYGAPRAAHNYCCLPEVGLFQLETTPLAFLNASAYCTNTSLFGGTAALAHVASANRTNALARLLSGCNQLQQSNSAQKNAGVHLAYVGLRFNHSSMQRGDFRTMDNESLRGFLYRAWAPGYPKRGGKFVNTSCVAITRAATWITVECGRPLPFICELYASQPDDEDLDDGVGWRDDECDMN